MWHDCRWLKKKLPVISICFVTHYIVVFIVMWSCSSKPSSSNLTERNQSSLVWEMAWLVSCTVVPPQWFSVTYLRRTSTSQNWDYLTLHKWQDFFSLCRRNNYLSQKKYTATAFWRKYSLQGVPNMEIPVGGGITSTGPWNGKQKCPL